MKNIVKFIFAMLIFITNINAQSDFGDAPNKYTHVSHQITNKLYLGNSKPDGESDQQSTSDASGDGSDDSNGIVGNLPTLTVGDHSYTVKAKVRNRTGQDAYITAWIDFNRNGTFEYSEALNTNDLKISSSHSPQTVNIVWDDFTDVETQAIATATAGKAIMRIRVSTSRILRCIEDTHKDEDENLFSPDGEVEDYEITIAEQETPEGEPFTCNNDGIIFSADGLTSTSTNFSVVDLETGTYEFKQEFATRHINAAGYNVRDNYIYGIGLSNDDHNTIDVVRVDSDYTVQKLNITGLPQGNSIYALGDVDFNNTLYVSTIQSENSNVVDFLKSLIVIDLENKKVERITPLIFPNGMTEITAADYAFNPIDEMLYTVDSAKNQLVRINPITGVVTLLGDVGNIGDVYSVISFFDLNGNFLFTNHDNNTIYKIDISNPNSINTNASVYISNLTMLGSGDGAKCAYSKIPNKEFLGVFNIERINSEPQIINSVERNAWYTQIVGRDFDYSVVFYEDDMSAEKKISNVTITVDLMNMDTNTSLYTYQFQVLENVKTSRIDFTLPHDLDTLPATKNARFKVTYGVNTDGSITQANCMTEPGLCNLTKSDLAKDNFAIRPDNFYLSIVEDALQITSSQNTPAQANLAAGYEYNLTAIASSYLSTPPAPSKGYNKTFEQAYELNTTGTCASHVPFEHTINFVNGKDNAKFSHDEVGKYIVSLYDADWTAVDQDANNLGCVLNSKSNVPDAEGRLGCDIALYLNDIELNFQPYNFDVELAMNNLPNSGHQDFIYMMELNQTQNNVAIAFQGAITAKNASNVTTKNFTSGCVAKNLLLDLNATTVSLNGVNQIIHTNAGTPVNFKKWLRFNDDDDTIVVTEEPNSQINGLVNIDASRFLDTNEGSVFLDMRYNLTKNLTEPTNPVEVTFNNIDISSEPAKSTDFTGIDKYIPKGSVVFPDNIKNFYFARVVSDANTYPRVNMNISPMVRTPLNVDFYCQTTVANYCNDRNVFKNSVLSGTSREQEGWYLSTNHNPALDGQVTTLVDNSGGNLIITPDTNISLPSGENGTIITRFDNCNAPSITVSINVDGALDFEPSEYTVSCTDNNTSQWTGIGSTGNVLEVTPKIDRSGKMDW